MTRRPLHQLMPGPNLPAGLNPLMVMHLAFILRNTHMEVTPIEVRGDSIVDGRHRWVASWIAGRYDIAVKDVA